MAKLEAYKYSVKDYFKFIRKRWYVILIVLVLGSIIGYYLGFKKDATTYSSTATVIFYNNKAELNENNAAYNQFSSIIKSANIYKELKYQTEEYDFKGVEVLDSKGVYTITTVSATPEMSTKTTDFIIKHAHEVIKNIYGENSGYNVALVSGPTSAEAIITTKDRLVSAAIVVVLAVFIAFAGLFISFNNIVKR